MTNDKKNLFSACEEISASGRTQAIEDGVLVDVTDFAKEVDFPYPVAITEELWTDIKDVPERMSWQDANSRFRDVLSKAQSCIRGHKPLNDADILYGVEMAVRYYTVFLVIRPGDDDKPVVTLMSHDENYEYYENYKRDED